LNIEVKENFEIKNYTSFKVGGKVDKLFFPKNQEEFVYLLSNLENPLILGSCSNILFSSQGYRGNIILTTKMNNFEIKENKVNSDCGVKGALISQKTCENSLSGFEFMIGFPGSIGGNIYMNASAHSQAISDTLVSAKVYDCDLKKIINLKKEELKFSYRHSILQEKNYVLLSAEFELNKSNQNDIKNLMTKNLEFRKNVQPSLANPNAGSIFKNPENNSAGKLLELSGAKELSHNDAIVWQKHANFIVNSNNASSEDILELMYKMADCVNKKQGIKLKPEVKYIGDKTLREEELCKILY